MRILVDTLQAAYDPAAQVLAPAPLLTLVIWTLIGLGTTARFFRWTP